MEKREKSRRQR